MQGHGGVCRRASVKMPLRRQQANMQALHRALLPQGHARKDERNNALLRAAHADIPPDSRDKAYCKGNVKKVRE